MKFPSLPGIFLGVQAVYRYYCKPSLPSELVSPPSALSPAEKDLGNLLFPSLLIANILTQSFKANDCPAPSPRDEVDDHS